MLRKFVFTVALLLSSTFVLLADEGMWMIHSLNEALEKKMQERGLELSAREIYNSEAPGTSLADAVVSLDFGCTGSIISKEGLLITNHHCAYSDLYRLSTPQCNYLEDGYWAYKDVDEIPIEGKSVQFLRKVIDVTEEAQEVIRKGLPGIPSVGARKLAFHMEKKYEKESGMMASLASMWGGSKYYICLYQEYHDVRLVAAPPICMASFGGDIDNWQWPQQKCDFAMYRVYTAPDGSPAQYAKENIPLHCANPLKIAKRAIREGDFAMVMGYPGSTDRYSSSFEVDYKQTVTLPLTNEIRGERLRIIKDQMNKDEVVRLKYSDKYFTYSNVHEFQRMQKECCDRFSVVAKKQELEKELQAWIEADSARAARWGSLLADLDKAYKESSKLAKNRIVFQEVMFRSTPLAVIATRLSSRGSRWNEKEWDAIDLPTERRVFDFSLRTWYEKMDEALMADCHKELYARYQGDYDQMVAAVWDRSMLTDGRFASADSLQRAQWADSLANDPLYQFFTSLKIARFNDMTLSRQLQDLNREYKQALYAMRLDKKQPQYPDANSTLRLTYGTVGPLAPADGSINKPCFTYPAQIIEKENPDVYEFRLRKDVKTALKKALRGKGHWGAGGRETMYVNFLSDNDISGGNSGSPVLNARGELIGLAFDGNSESLASDVDYTLEYNKCVSVDIRYVLWTLDKYAHMKRILKELEKK
jgi:hypothetical protein